MTSDKSTGEWRVIGIDCATDPRKVGVALVDQLSQGWILREAKTCGSDIDPVELIAKWSTDCSCVLLALDAPLGWPREMAVKLQHHSAGEAISVPANSFFRRETDIYVHSITGKTPLDVGADRIARTAHWALRFLESLRSRTAQRIPLAWSPELNHGVHAIEVYPAATLLAHGANLRGYKAASGVVERRTIMELLRKRLQCDGPFDACLHSADVLDAVVCALAGIDFLEDCAVPPSNTESARKEGWIWFRRFQ
jgi:predicted RNase H-like nuclease